MCNNDNLYNGKALCLSIVNISKGSQLTLHLKPFLCQTSILQPQITTKNRHPSVQFHTDNSTLFSSQPIFNPTFLKTQHHVPLRIPRIQALRLRSVRAPRRATLRNPKLLADRGGTTDGATRRPGLLLPREAVRDGQKGMQGQVPLAQPQGAEIYPLWGLRAGGARPLSFNAHFFSFSLFFFFF